MKKVFVIYGPKGSGKSKFIERILKVKEFTDKIVSDELLVFKSTIDNIGEHDIEFYKTLDTIVFDELKTLRELEYAVELSHQVKAGILLETQVNFELKEINNRNIEKTVLFLNLTEIERANQLEKIFSKNGLSGHYLI
ncbi:MAG: hypothetical protein J0M25_00785 [Flavobacteriales bacterium]|nr:hypothetical protein [Flavobacteriales bacterium]